MTGVAPSPDGRLAHDHETRDVVDHVIHPPGLEGGAMAAFVPSRVGGRSVENSVGDEKWQGEPARPEIIGKPARRRERSDPQSRVANGGAVSALHQFF